MRCSTSAEHRADCNLGRTGALE